MANFVRAPHNTETVPVEAVSEACTAFMSAHVRSGMPMQDKANDVLRSCSNLLQCTFACSALQLCIYWERLQFQQHVDWIAGAVESSCSDELIHWLVVIAKIPVSDYALECACRNDWWKTTLPILLLSSSGSGSDVFLKYAVLHPEQLAVLPQQFQARNKNLRLQVRSWICTAANAAFTVESEEEMINVRTALESMIESHNDDKFPALRFNNSGGGVSISKFKPSMQPAVDLDEHVEWMNHVLSQVDGVRNVVEI